MEWQRADKEAQRLPVWPAEQKIETRGDPAIHVTTFGDAGAYHKGLIANILKLEIDPSYGKEYFRAAGGTKIHHVDRWGFAEANLINGRAIALFKRVWATDEAVVDLSWANVYREGDYAMAHAHTRSTASVVYFLDAGDDDPEDPAGGRFCFVDPRLACCCQEEPGMMTSPYLPRMTSGTMIIFPSHLVHCVNPYNGTRPRITIAWNINRHVIPGSPLPEEE